METTIRRARFHGLPEKEKHKEMRLRCTPEREGNMKRRTITALGLALGISLTAVGCSGVQGTGAAAGTAADTTAYAGQTVYGIVESVDKEAGTMTVTLGEVSEDGTTVTAGTDSLVVPITEDTRVSGTHGGKGRREGWQSSAGSDTDGTSGATKNGGQQPPELPEGQQPPELPEGQELPQLPEDQELPQLPEGQQPPELPEGQQLPELPEGQQPPELPEGQQLPELPDGSTPEQSDGDQDTETDTVSGGRKEKRAGGQKQKSGGERQKNKGKGGARLTEGVSVAITFDGTGAAVKVKILSGSGNEEV